MGFLRVVLVAVLLLLSVAVPILLIEKIAEDTMNYFVWFGGAAVLVAIFSMAMLLLR